MAIETESERGCGFRKIGALYLVGFGVPHPCDRPMAFIDGVCDHGVSLYIEQFRGIKHFSFEKYVNGQTHLEESGECNCPIDCYICNPDMNRDIPDFLMFVGKKFYTPESFLQEAFTMGISKRIPYIPDDLIVGQSRVYLAYPNLYPVVSKSGRKRHKNGIFYVYTVQAVEMPVNSSMMENEEFKEKLDERITPIEFPDDYNDNVSIAHKKNWQSNGKSNGNGNGNGNGKGQHNLEEWM